MEKLWTKNFSLLVLITLAAFTVRQMAMSTFPMLVTWAGGSTAAAGKLTLLLTVASIAVRLVSGPLTDRYGRRSFMVIGAGIFACSTLVIALFPKIWVIAAMQLLFGAGLSCITTASGAAVADVTPPARLGEGMGFYTLGNSVAMAIGPAAGLWLIGLGTGNNYRGLYLAATLVLAAAGVMGALVNYRAPRKDSISFRLKEVLEPAALPASFLELLAVFSFTSVISYIASYAKETGIGSIGSFFLVYAAGMIAVRLIVGKVVDKKSERMVVMAAMALMAAAFAGIVKARTLTGLMVRAVLLGLGQGAVMPSLQKAAMKRVLPERRGAGNATYQLFSDIGTGFGAAVWGALAESAGYPAIYLGASAVCIAGFFLSAVLLGGQKKIETKRENTYENGGENGYAG